MFTYICNRTTKTTTKWGWVILSTQRSSGRGCKESATVNLWAQENWLIFRFVLWILTFCLSLLNIVFVISSAHCLWYRGYGLFCSPTSWHLKALLTTSLHDEVAFLHPFSWRVCTNATDKGEGSTYMYGLQHSFCNREILQIWIQIVAWNSARVHKLFRSVETILSSGNVSEWCFVYSWYPFLEIHIFLHRLTKTLNEIVNDASHVSDFPLWENLQSTGIPNVAFHPYSQPISFRGQIENVFVPISNLTVMWANIPLP